MTPADPEYSPVAFIDELIEVSFDRPPLLAKKPGPPSGFTWRGRPFRVCSVLSSWLDYQRRGRMAKNMSPAHSAGAAKRVSWGVGRFCFRLETEGGRIFDVYNDRAPKDAGDRAARWFLFREMTRAAGL